mmetsp:Transcript_18642/g.40045  ORF Transcript_18642/g.40045 Transcript_18642/m.40045 type:complete len:358 (+) Transcript_18642:176-1249(+)|eukprot:CAMPEP_0202891798 /NCGR_PEP_ID=MMETSP1392-20130828/1765_1 /ASSEMBLY_ACC=CAM_ASM_000868 /TAXON_ID=225041 /ORGANISM="Chlamydomonas chlamydogama, Strain SAG 11-48b" /LENGTH=357 /DNA_ID=CAMNT_0049575653 /DNA_START=136 /DNA_END=1209 /DNA_ORIENTATION=+
MGKDDVHVAVPVIRDEEKVALLDGRRASDAPKQRSQTVVFAILAAGSILSAIGFSAVQEWVFSIPGFYYGGWMTFITYLTYAICGWMETLITRKVQRHGRLRDYCLVSVLAMGGAYFTNWALNYLNYTTRIVFKSCRVLPVMAFRTLVVGQRYSAAQYCAGLLLVVGIALFTMGDADGIPNFSWAGIALISVALVCDAMTANLEEKQFFRIRVPCSHAEVMLYLSTFAAFESFVVLYFTGELWDAVEHSLRHTNTVPCICIFSVLGYITVSLILLIIKGFGATNAEIVKSMRKVCQVAVSFTLFPKPFSWKYAAGGMLVALALYWLHGTGKKPHGQETHHERSGGSAGEVVSTVRQG